MQLGPTWPLAEVRSAEFFGLVLNPEATVDAPPAIICCSGDEVPGVCDHVALYPGGPLFKAAQSLE